LHKTSVTTCLTVLPSVNRIRLGPRPRRNSVYHFHLLHISSIYLGHVAGALLPQRILSASLTSISVRIHIPIKDLI